MSRGDELRVADIVEAAEHRARHPSVPWRHIINLRHLIAHHCHRVDMDQLWTIATVNIPEVLEELAPE